MKKIVVFDLDGTVWRSVAWSIDLFFKKLAQHGVAITPALRQAVAEKWGIHFAELREEFFPQLANETVYGIYDSLRPIVEIVPFCGAAHALATMRSRGADLYALTSRPRLHTRELLNRFGLMRYFARILCVEDVGWENAKPSSYGLELILGPLERILGLSRNDAVYVGDGLIADRLCAAEAGVDFIAVHEENVVTRERWRASGVRDEDILGSIRALPARLGIE